MVLPNRFIVLDFKTTSFTEKAHVISCSVIDQDGNLILDSLVKPDCIMDISPIHNFHKINTDDVYDLGITKEALFDKLSDIFDEYSYLVIYNAEFDKKFIPKNLVCKIPIYCAMDISIGFINQHPSYQKIGQYLKLNCFAALLNINTMNVDTLTSLGDAELCRRVWIEMSQVGHNLEIPFEDIVGQFVEYRSNGYHND